MHSTRIAPLFEDGQTVQERPTPPAGIDGPWLPSPPRFALDRYRTAVGTLRARADVGALDRPGSPSGACWDLRWSLDPGASTAVVLAGHAGAGSTTVALAVAEAVAERAVVQVVDCSEPLRCGLGAASRAELGADEGGWRHGRRSELRLVRRGGPGRPTGPAWLAVPSRSRARVRVLDLGTLAGSALGALGSAGTDVMNLVVVTRLTTPAVRQTEAVLLLLDRPVLVATVGRYAWGRSLPPLGPRLRQAGAAGRLVRVPWNRRLATEGLSGDPLPAAVARAGSALASRLSVWTASPVGPAPRPAGEPLR